MDALVFIIGIFMHCYGRIAIRFILIRPAGLVMVRILRTIAARILRTIFLRAARCPVSFEVESLKCHNCSPLKQGCIVGKCKIHDLFALLRCKGRFRGHFRSVSIFECFSVRLVNKESGHKIILPGDQSLAGDMVNCDCAVACLPDMHAGQLVLRICLNQYQMDRLCLIFKIRMSDNVPAAVCAVMERIPVNAFGGFCSGISGLAFSG